MASLLDDALLISPRVAPAETTLARVPRDYASAKHELYRFIQFNKFIAKGGPGHTTSDLKLSEVWPDFCFTQVSRSCSDFVCRYHLKQMAALAGAATQRVGTVNADTVYVDGSHVCKSKRDYFMLQSEGLLSVMIHQKMDDFAGDGAPVQAADVARERFDETSFAKARTKRI